MKANTSNAIADNSTFPYTINLRIKHNSTINIIFSSAFLTIISAIIFNEHILPSPGKLTPPEIKQYKYSGLGGVEFGHEDYWRWAFGPETTVTFITYNDKEMTLSCSFNSPIEGQSMTIYINNELLRHYEALPANFFGNKIIHDKIKFHTTAGENTLKITYADWNGYKSHPINSNEKYAICFYRFYISK